MVTALSKWRRIPLSHQNFDVKLNHQLKNLGKDSVHPLVANFLQSLGLTNVLGAIRFLYPEKEHCHSPWMLKGMDEAVKILEEAIVLKKKIAVVGDYDVDGVVATYIAYRTLEDLGAEVIYIIPHRKKNGYGIKPAVVEEAKKAGAEIILTVDNGISAHEAVQAAKANGMTILITDHHQPGETLPDADCIINPHQAGCPYPYKDISGGTIAFKLSQALYEYMGVGGEFADIFLDYLAISIIADVMPLFDENRYFVQKGLEKIRNNPSRPIKALCKALGINHKEADISTVGFYVGPAINAPGRLDSADVSMKLFLAEKPLEAAIQANICVQMNGKRKELVENALKEAETSMTDEPVKILRLDVEEGIAGIVASQIKEQTGSPVFVLTSAVTGSGEEILKGSARSPEGFSLFECLKEISEDHPDWFVNWGGHSSAAGISLKPDRLEDFRRKINEIYGKFPVKGTPLYYLEEVGEDELDFLSREFKRLFPFGYGQQEPIFKVRTTILESVVFGKKKNHLRLFGDEGVEYTLFHGADYPLVTNREANLYVTLGRSVFAGREKLNVFVRDIEQ